jgi:tetratricopeptide (TPR) repeat protein
MAMSMSKRFGSKDQAALFLSFYPMVGWRFEPMRSCANNLLRGFESGLSIGDAHSAFHSTLQHIRFAFFSGENLQKMLKDIDYYLGLMAEYNNEMVKNFMLILRETFSTLFDKGEASSIDEKAVYATANGNDANVNADDQHFLMSYCYKIVQSFWLGHHERCNHQMGKLPTNLSPIHLQSIWISFYFGMNALQLLRKNGLAAQVKIYEESIAILIEAEENSSGSFRNKILLMKAELMSIDRVRGAEEMYDAAIDAARMNGFVHEEGLTCERAAHHYLNCYNVDKRLFLLEKSWQYFMLAKNCYQRWGSKMKANSIDRELEKLWTNEPMIAFRTSIMPGGM